MEERILWIWLAEALHYHPKQIASVCQKFSFPQEVYDLKFADLQKLGFLSRAEQSALSDKDLSKVYEKINGWNQQGVWTLTPADSDYPSHLAELPDRPAVLFGRGKLPDFSAFSLALSITGTRRCSRYGERTATRFAREMAEANTLLVSGLSEGIETLATDSAERAGGTILAVVPGGVDQIYPRSNRLLFERILSRGAIVSEFPPGMPLLRHLMPYRNRLLSGFSHAVLVLEAGHRSGTRITTDYALEQGRDVLAVPGNIDNEKSVGTNRLIQDGAMMILEVADIFALYPNAFPKNPAPLVCAEKPQPFSRTEQLVYEQLDRDEPVCLDVLAEKTGLPFNVLTLVLTQLELAGHVIRLPQNRVVRK